MSQTSELKNAGLQDIPLSAIKEQFQDVLARSSSSYDAEYGTHADNNALIFHFFPPGYAENSGAKWPNWEAFGEKLEAAVLRCFGPTNVDLDYVPELKSFCIIVKPKPLVPDLSSLIERFFSVLES
jgi:hypothetical protein